MSKAMAPLSYEGQIALFDVTIPCDATESQIHDYRELAVVLNTIAKKWVFQKEKGETTDYIHWQVRLSLHKKARCSALLKDIVPHLPGHWSVTSNAVHDSGNQFNYVMKIQTRIEGPWTDKDCIRDPAVMTDQLQHFLAHDLYPWQTKALDIVKSYDERKLHYLYDPHYNSGKSIFCEWIEYQELGEEIPPFTLMEDIMQFVMCQPKSKCYLFDMPAAMKKERMHQMYSGLEMLKNGFLYDKRYNGKKQRISRPIVMCFANNLPQMSLMAPDRWQVLYITPQKDLVAYDPAVHPFMPSQIQFHTTQFD